MPEKMSIGQMLRKHREDRGLTPEQAAYQSKVPLRLLQALEADDYRLLPDPAYLIRLLHEYALLLKLDPKALEAEFRSAIRRPPGASLVAIPSQPPPAPIPWKQVLWTAAAILVVTPLVFIALSLASKRAAERPALPQAARPERSRVEAEAPAMPDRLPAMPPEGVQPEETGGTGAGPAPPPRGFEAARPGQQAPAIASAQAERRLRRFLLTAHALEPTWMVVRGDGGEQREVLLQKGQTARFVADAGFVVTVGNAGGVELSLNGKLMPSLGASGQVVRDLAIPPAARESEALGAASPGPAPER
jgi:cytoskeleton protein RodZ